MQAKPKAKPREVDFSTKEYSTEQLPVIKVSYAAVLTRPLYYPENQFAKALSYLLRRITFTKAEVEHLRDMGFVVEISLREIQIPDGCK